MTSVAQGTANTQFDTVPAMPVGVTTPPFGVRPGPARRVLQLLRRAGPIAAVRGGMSLLYARLSLNSRVKYMREWSREVLKAHAYRARDGVVGSQADARPADIAHLLARVVATSNADVSPDVLRMVAHRFCRSSPDAELAALLRAACKDGAVPATGHGADLAKSILAEVLYAEVARRFVAGPLRALAEHLECDCRADVIDDALVRLGVGLQKAGGDLVANELMLQALWRMSDGELRAFAKAMGQTPPGAGRGSMGAGGAAADAGALGRERILNVLRTSHAYPANALQRRGDLLNAVDVAVRNANEHVLGHYAAVAGHMMDRALAQGVPVQDAHAHARHRLQERLVALGYIDTPPDGQGEELVSRVVLRALASKSDADLRHFLGALKASAIADLHRVAILPSAGSFIPPAVVAAVKYDYTGRSAASIGLIQEKLPALHDAASAKHRWQAIQAMVELLKAATTADVQLNALGMEIPDDIVQAAKAGIAQGVTLLRDPAEPAGELSHASISGLAGEEIELLRQCVIRLQDLGIDAGLALDSQALQQEAELRARPFLDIAARHAEAALLALASIEADPRPVVRALRNYADNSYMACRIMRQLVDVGGDDIGHRAWQTVQGALKVLSERQPDLLEALHSNDRSHAHVLAYVFRQSVEQLSRAERQPDDETLTEDQHARRLQHVRASALSGLGSMFLKSLQDTLDAFDFAEGSKVPGRSRTAVVTAKQWTASLREVVAQEFGVDYDAATRAAHPALPPGPARAIAQRLDTPIRATDDLVQWKIETPEGPAIVPVDVQFYKDALDRTSSGFSVRGIGMNGRYMPYVDSTLQPGELAPRGADRALLALHRLAGPDTPALTAYITQSIGAPFLLSLRELGTDNPLRLADGTPVEPGGGGGPVIDILRFADGSYELRVDFVMEPLSRLWFFGKADEAPVPIGVDPGASHVALGYTQHLQLHPNGEQSIKTIGMPELRYCFARPERLG